ncbi:MAG: TonB-dependent receptor [Gemmatimonadetes bacterium]|nr:TonB-dependent receptor [Gemmatimonadota bacterium]
MTRTSPAPWAALFLALLSLYPSAPAQAQGVTTAAVSGKVTDPDGNPLSGSAVKVTNEATGVVRGSVADAAGQYYVPGLQVGGPYTAEASSIGYAASSRGDIQLTLGQKLVLNFELQVQAVAVAGITVVGDPTVTQVINAGRTGAEQLVTDNQIRNLPTITRNFTDFISLSPLVGAGGGATSVGQQNNRFNNIQIDGAITQDLFGLGATGQPGGQAGARSISIEAVKEYQVLTAPFDVRQSGFSGGLINAVTKSGTNQFRVSGYGFMRNESFVRENLAVAGRDVPIGDFKNRLVGGTISGPLVQDRAHFFVAGEFEADERPSSGIAIGREAPAVTGIDPAKADSFATLLTQKGVQPLSFGARTIENPNNNLFGRIDAQLTPTHALTLRHNWVKAEDDNVQDRSATGTRYSFESNGYFFESNTNSTVAQLNSTFSNGSYNELIAGWTRIRDRRSPETRYPVVEVRVTSTIDGKPVNKFLRAGAEFFSQANELDQDSWELTDNFSFSKGDHRITVGVHDEIFKFRNLFAPGSIGQWDFGSLTDFANNKPNRYSRNPPFQPGLDLNARFTVNQFALYAQTEWTGLKNVVVTGGLRYDIPFVGDEPAANAKFAAAFDPAKNAKFGQAFPDAFARSTDEVASGNGILSPRLGFNWDIHGDRTAEVRGGVGIFTGRHPYVWLSNIFSNNGLQQVTINCTTAATIPDFTLDPANQPSTCKAAGLPEPPRAAINLIDPDFKYPHHLRADLAVDHELPFGVVGTVEFLYNKARKQIFLRELNVDFSKPVSTTQGGRPVFGTQRAGALAAGAGNNNLATPNRLSNDFLQVVELTNSDQDRAWSLTLQAQKRYARGLELNGSYTYADAKDVSGLTSSIATSNIGFNPVKGSPNAPELATSDYETRHKVVLSGSYDVRSWLTWSVFYVGNAGDGYSYTYDGDVNADGYEAPNANNRNNDLLYVPTGPTDITLTSAADWARIDAYINGEQCLRENRGKIMSRNACFEPWHNRVDTRLTFRVPTVRGQRAELIFDVFNVLNLINKDWGLNEGVLFQTIELLELRGWDVANNRGIFRPAGGLRLDANNNPIVFQTFDPSSRWQAQLGIRYSF